MRRLACLMVVVLGCVWPLSAQWTNRYQRIGQGHHVYIEGYDFPTYSTGPTYPAVSPDGRLLVFSARGWLWTMSTAGGPAERLTRGRALDSRPAWHPDGVRIAFVRDDTRDTDIIEIDRHTGVERVLVSGPAAELDPAYSPDGKTLFFASAETGDLEIYKLELSTSVKTRLTDSRGLDLRPQPLASGAIVFVSKRGGGDEIALLEPDGTRRILAVASVASLARPAVSADGRRIAVPLPVLSSTDWALQLLDPGGGPMTEILSGGSHPVMPTWTPDGSQVYFARAGEQGVFDLWRVSGSGGDAERIVPTAWNWKAPTATVVVRTRTMDAAAQAAARLQVVGSDGHPAFPTGGQVWLDGQHGALFAYSPGTIEYEVPAGSVRVVAAHGFEYLPLEWTGEAIAGQRTVVALELAPVGGPSLEHWFSGDHHFHLNYGGQVRLTPDALVTMMRGEDLDVATPLSANLHTRRIDERYFGWTRREPPLIQFGQEIRSHFLGHTGHIGIRSLYWPWYWGPGYPVYGLDDRSNHEALQRTRAQGGVNSYVHPVSTRTPFAGKIPVGIPLELVSDAVLGDVDTIELACLWSDELGTADAWYRLLNVGAAIAPSAGTDAMVDFFRTMAIGTTRVYVNVPPPLSLERYLANLKAGHSFVTTGPLLQFRVHDSGPGQTVTASRPSTPWTLTVTSAVPYERVELLVNGSVVWSSAGAKSAASVTYDGTLDVPSGGWIAARVHGAASAWPMMDSYPFAHTAPVWVGSVGSIEPGAARAAATDLLAVLDAGEARVRQAYQAAPATAVLGRIAAARQKLQALRGETRP